MKFASAVVAFLAVLVNTAAAIRPKPMTDIKADSKLGTRLLSKARALDNNDADATWIAGYSIKFKGCHEVTQYGGEEQNNDEDGNALYTQRLVHFYLCPTSSCATNTGNSVCKGGAEYIVDMIEFVDAYTESKMEAQEYACEMVRENCYCDNANDDDVCANQCYQSAGLDYCVQYDGEEEFDIQRALECGEMENNNGNNNIQYFVGPYCSADGSAIHIGIFKDETCSTPADSSVYTNYNYGNPLPYSTESLVGSDCISCKEVDDDQNNNQNQNYDNQNYNYDNQNYNYDNQNYDYNNQNNNNQNYQEEQRVIEMCERLYEMSGKCESGLSKDDISYYYFYPNTQSCDYIHNILPKLENVSRGGGAGHTAAIFFSCFFGVACVVIGYYAWTFHNKANRSNVDLAAQDHADPVEANRYT